MYICEWIENMRIECGGAIYKLDSEYPRAISPPPPPVLIGITWAAGSMHVGRVALLEFHAAVHVCLKFSTRLFTSIQP